MKTRILLIIALLSGCAQLSNGQVQPVVVKDSVKQIFLTNCGGAVEDWGTCHSKAMNACVNGYTIIQKVQNSTGTQRELTFKCIK